MVDKSKLPKVKYHPTDKYMNAVIESYENYREEERLTTDRGRRVEFLTTMRILREWIEQKKLCILDVAAGTGVYAFPLSKEGHEVTATDITPRHVQIMNQIIKEKGYPIKTAVMDACNLDGIPDESYDIVLNMGPFYHLTDFDAREKCLAECLRVLKKDGLLVTAYIPRFSVFAYVALQNPNYLNEVLSKQIISTGTLHSDDDYCFTCYCHKPQPDKKIEVITCQKIESYQNEVDGLFYKEFEGGKFASIYHSGSYLSLPESYNKIIDYLDTNELTISSNIREVYIDGIWNKDDQSQWLTQIQIPIE